MSYESPITFQIAKDMELQMEKDVMRAVQQYNIHIDKNELERALRYDRVQYDKGFRDGVAEVWSKKMMPSDIETIKKALNCNKRVKHCRGQCDECKYNYCDHDLFKAIGNLIAPYLTEKGG